MHEIFGKNKIYALRKNDILHIDIVQHKLLQNKLKTIVLNFSRVKNEVKKVFKNQKSGFTLLVLLYIIHLNVHNLFSHML